MIPLSITVLDCIREAAEICLETVSPEFPTTILVAQDTVIKTACVTAAATLETNYGTISLVAVSLWILSLVNLLARLEGLEPQPSDPKLYPVSYRSI
jgi:hypothetical protein